MMPTQFDLITEYERATNSHDLEATLSLIDEQAIYLFSDESAHIGKDAVRDVLTRNFELIQDESYSIENLTWIAQSETVAVCVYDYFWNGLIDGQPAAGSGRGTSVLTNSSGGWKVVHEHLSKGAFAS